MSFDNPSPRVKIHLRKEMNFPKQKIFVALLDLAQLKQLSPKIKTSRTLESSLNSSLTEWSLDLEGIPLQWVERTTFSRQEFKISFKSEKGDLKTFEGQWHVFTEGDHSILELKAEIDLGIPLLADLVGDELKKRVQQHFQTLINELAPAVQGKIYRQSFKSGKVSGYAVVGHHANFEHMVGYFKTMDPNLKVPSKDFLTKLFDLSPSHKSCDIYPIHSTQGIDSRGHWITCPFIPAMMEVDLEKVFYKVLEACRIAEGLNVGIVTLGGFTSIVGEQFGKEIHKMVTVPVTTGNTYTAALVVRGVLEACEKMRVPISQQKLVIFGGSGDIGSACALALSKKVKHLKLIGRDVEKLEKTRNKLKGATAEISIGTDLAESIPDADIIIAATSATSALVDSSMFQPGTIICDVGYPKNIAYKLGDRDDLMIFAGGLCQLPSKFELGLKADYGLHHDRVLYGCLSEAIVLDLEKRYESYSAGRGNITVEKMDAIYEMGLKHGFSLAPFLMGDRILDENDFDRLSEIRAKIS